MPDDNSNDTLATRLRGWAALVVAFTGLATAIWKPQDHTVAKAGYEELAKDMEAFNVELKSNHDSVVALRAYINAKEGQPLFAPAVAPSAASGKGGAGVRSSITLTKKATAKIVAAVVAAAPEAVAAAPAEEPPELPPAPSPVHPESFDSVLKSAK
jgi:hypothetical protein